MGNELVELLLAGNRRALARTISEVEDQTPASRGLLATLFPHTGRAHIVGITGSPGTGKSTLVNALARAHRTAGQTVGIIAVDPTSPFSGGALLGDRVRMRDLAGDAGIFIRSMATRGSLGGLARTTADVLMVLDAAGFDRILIETVGVGQAEIDIASAAHTTIVVEAPGLGDEVQAIKAGVLEIADIFAVNKADRDGADHTAMALQMMQGLAPAPSAHHRPTSGSSSARPQPGAQADDGWLPPIVKTIAVRGEGVDGLCQWVERHAEYLRTTGQLGRREEARAASEVDHILRDALLADLMRRLPPDHLRLLAAGVARREIDPYSAVDQLLVDYGCRS